MTTDMKFLPRDDLEKAFLALAAQGMRVIAPVRSSERTEFAVLKEGVQVDLQAVCTATPLKSLFFPRWEELMHFERSSSGVRTRPVVVETCESVVVGARPCDARALVMLDAVFGSPPEDTHWTRRRQSCTIVSVACEQPDAHCFCTSVGGAPDGKEGADVLLRPSGDGWLFEVVTEKGKRLEERLADFLTEEKDSEPYVAPEIPTFPLPDLGSDVMAQVELELWKPLGLRCVGCGACAFVCPTCHCYDINDEGTETRGRRVRSWDSCGFALFTLHAAGTNPRPTQIDRIRQRFLHKFSYMPMRLGFAGCVGCGRCERVCPVGIGVPEVLESLNKEWRKNG